MTKYDNLPESKRSDILEKAFGTFYAGELKNAKQDSLCQDKKDKITRAATDLNIPI